METTRYEKWAAQEFGDANLGDPRRTRRLVAVGAACAAHPAGKVTEVFTEGAGREGAYRLLENDHVAAAEIAAAARRAGARRTWAQPHVFVPIDGSSLNIVDSRACPRPRAGARPGGGLAELALDRGRARAQAVAWPRGSEWASRRPPRRWPGRACPQPRAGTRPGSGLAELVLDRERARAQALAWPSLPSTTSGRGPRRWPRREDPSGRAGGRPGGGLAELALDREPEAAQACAPRALSSTASGHAPRGAPSLALPTTHSAADVRRRVARSPTRPRWEERNDHCDRQVPAPGPSEIDDRTIQSTTCSIVARRRTFSVACARASGLSLDSHR
jgi:hypothetical protein